MVCAEGLEIKDVLFSYCNLVPVSPSPTRAPELFHVILSVWPLAGNNELAGLFKH